MKMFRVVVNGSEYKVGIEELAEEAQTPSVQTKAAAPTTPKPVVSKPQPAPPAQQINRNGDTDHEHQNLT